MATPKSKSQAFEDYRKKHGSRHKADPKHAMNAERTGPSTVKKMAKGGKLKMVEKNGKKVPFFAADGVGKMAKGGSIKVSQATPFPKLQKKKGVTLKSLLAANPGIKNANQIRVGQSIKIPGATAGKAKSKNPYAGMSKTQMNMLDVKNKDRGKQEAVTRAMRTQVKSSGSPTTPNASNAAKVMKSKDGSKSAMDRARKQRDSGKPGFSRLFGGTRRKPAVPSNDIAAKKGGYMKKKSGGAMKKKYQGTNLAV